MVLVSYPCSSMSQTHLIYGRWCAYQICSLIYHLSFLSKTADNYPSKHAGSKTADNYPSKHAGSKTADNYPSKHAGSKTADNYPSKHAGSDSHPVRIGWEALATTQRTGWFWHTGLLPDRIRLAKSWHYQPELNRIRAGFAQYCPGSLWKNGTKSESGKLVAGRLRPARNRARWFLYTSLLPDQMCLAKPWPGHPDRIRVGFALKKKKKKKTGI